jgi:hypothetical protein
MVVGECLFGKRENHPHQGTSTPHQSATPTVALYKVNGDFQGP